MFVCGNMFEGVIKGEWDNANPSAYSIFYWCCHSSEYIYYFIYKSSTEYISWQSSVCELPVANPFAICMTRAYKWKHVALYILWKHECAQLCHYHTQWMIIIIIIIVIQINEKKLRSV